MSDVLHITVHGRVQGVGFRQFVLETAHDLGVRGWVRNTPQGTVEALAEVSAANRQRFLDALREGPSLARVQDVTVRPAQRVEGMPEQGFRVRH